MLKDIANQEIKKRVTVKGTLILQSRARNGVSVIRDTVSYSLDNVPEDVKVLITVVGSPRYLIKVEADDAEDGKEVMRQFSENCINKVKELGGKGEFKE